MDRMPLKFRGNNAACLLAVSSRLFSSLTSETGSHVQHQLISSVSNRRPGTEITTTRRLRALEGRRARPAADTRHTAATTAANRVRDSPPPRAGDIGLLSLGSERGQRLSPGKPCHCTARGCFGRADSVCWKAKLN